LWPVFAAAAEGVIIHSVYARPGSLRKRIWFARRERGVFSC
jgi:hypothetical protein